ncbi:MAG: hypothetical protein JSR97_07470 [Verrucomicrobia bacterium]|nr:hypothetical protein [Verrucomicrobiota bacterium]
MYYFEKYYPLAISALLTFLVYKYQVYLSDFKTLVPQIAQNSLTISGTLLGFLLTILTIVNTINTRRMQFVKDSGHFERLLNFLNVSIKANIVVIVLSFLVIFLNRDKISDTVFRYIDFCFIFITLFAIFLTVRFAIIFIQLLTDKKKGDRTT